MQFIYRKAKYKLSRTHKQKKIKLELTKEKQPCPMNKSTNALKKNWISQVIHVIGRSKCNSNNYSKN